MEWFDKLFDNQVELQKIIKGKFDSLENVLDMYYSATAMMVEIGEMLQTDTRWKEDITGSVKKPYYDSEEFITELSDVLLYLLNTLIYAGIDLDSFKKAVANKQLTVKQRFTEYGSIQNRT